jgi:Spy/CpxP family protein refolding chaperone
VLHDDFNSYSYETDAGYFGAHLGVGKEFQTANNDTVDVYAKYFFNRRNGASFTVENQQFDLDAANASLDEQKAKLKDLKSASESNREAQKKVREATMKQVELMKAERIDEAAVMAAIDEVFELRKAMAKDQAKRVIAVKSILTPEQVAKAHEEMKKMFEARGDRGPRREGKGPREFKGPRRGPHGEKGPKGGPKDGGDAPAPAPEAE